MTEEKLSQLERRVKQLEEEVRELRQRAAAPIHYQPQPFQGQYPQHGQQVAQHPPHGQHSAQRPQHIQNDAQQQHQYEYPQQDMKPQVQHGAINAIPPHQAQSPYGQRPPMNHWQRPPQNQSPHTAEMPGEHRHSPFVPHPDIANHNKQPRDLEKVLVRVWLPRVFIVVLLFGVLWGFLAAVKEGYFTEAVRCWIGAAVAAVMYFIGVRQINKDRAGLGKVLIGGSQAIFIITISAAHLMYELIPIWLAIVAYMATVIVAILTSLKWRSETLIVLSTLAGYLFPFLLDSASPSTLLFVGYQTLFSIVLLIIASRLKYIIAYWFAFGMLHCAFVVAIALSYIEHAHISMTAVIIQHLALFILFVWRNRNAIEQNILQIFSTVLLWLWSYSLYDDTKSIVYSIVLLLSIALYAYAAYHFHQLYKNDDSQKEQSEHAKQRGAISMVIVNVAILLFVLQQFNYTYGVVAIFIQGLLSILLGIRLRYLPQRIIGIVITVIASINMMTNVPIAIVSEETFAWLVLLIGIPVLYAGCRKWLEPEKFERSRDTLSLLWWAEAAIGFIFLTIMVNIATEELATELRHFTLSGAWLLYALAAIVLGLVWKKAKARLTGIIMLFAILLKVLLVDLPDVSLTIRALIFIILGVVGIFASRVLYSNKTDTSDSEDTENTK